jgi:hypothetical protein
MRIAALAGIAMLAEMTARTWMMALAGVTVASRPLVVRVVLIPVVVTVKARWLIRAGR